MKGYYKRPEATEAVLKDGWLNTGDIVIATRHNEIKIVGRAKETIVLLGGENIEPNPIEEKLSQSPYIDQVMVLGQDQKFLAALVIPSKEALEAVAEEKNIPYQQYEDLVASSEIQTLINDEVQSLISSKTGFKAYERVFRIKLLPNPFEVGKEMTQTLKVKRDVVNDVYKKEIKQLFV
jgi:long-chain acyl-CoA synthetase